MTPARPKSLIVPREHGAWGILLVPLVTGAATGLFAGGSVWPLAPLTVAVLALFWLRTPVESWVGASPIKARTPEEFRLVRKASFILAAVSLAAALTLFWGGRHLGLLSIGAAAGAAFLGQEILHRRGRATREASQIVGAAGLTAVAPAAFYAVTGHFPVAAYALWIANLLFAANQIQFVQLRIRAARAFTLPEKLAAGRTFLISQLLLAVILAASCLRGAFPWYAAAAFLPILYRGFAWFLSGAQPLVIHALGKRELYYACAFGVLLTAGLTIA
jgi:hypothetical protein